MYYIFLILCTFFSQAVNANFEKNIVGESKNWTVLKANPNENSVCYAILYTQGRKGNQVTTEEKPYIMVHYFSESKIRFSAYFGYKLLESQPVHISIDSTQYRITPLDEYAVTQTAQQDSEIIEKLKTGKELLIRGEGVNHSYSVDQYSIEGFSKAFAIMQEKCDSNANNSTFKTIVPEKSAIKKL